MKTRSETNRLVKECIATALIELMKVRDYNSITITDITKKAGVSRMAYYRNYSSKEDILNQYMDELGNAIHEKVSKHITREELHDYYKSLFEQLGVHRDLGLTAHRAHLSELILLHINKNMALTFPPDSSTPSARYRHFYMAGAFYNVLMEWLKNGMQESSDQMARICCEMTCAGCDILEKERGENQ